MASIPSYFIGVAKQLVTADVVSATSVLSSTSIQFTFYNIDSIEQQPYNKPTAERMSTCQMTEVSDT